MMNNKFIISLIFSLSTLFTSLSFANSPAEFESPAEEAQAEPVVTAEDDGRPATAENMPAKPETNEVKQQTGDSLNMPAQVEKEAVAQASRQLDFPRRGMTEDKVQNELGRPLEIIAAVGKPPISRWIYNDRIVYFEYSSVVHVVAK